MKELLKITGINYLNTKPFLWGLVKNELPFKIDLQLDNPANCAKRLISGDADLGLIPVAALPQLPNPTIISDYCIGSHGAVDTVSIFSEVPIKKVTHLYLDYQSMSSNLLARVLCKKFWKISPKIIQGEQNHDQLIGGKVAGVLIGDRVFKAKKKFKYEYDLSQSWNDFTGLPFVFAVWVSTRPIDQATIETLNQCFKEGVENIDKLLFLLPESSRVDMHDYLTNKISYNFDDAKKKGLKLYQMYAEEVLQSH